VVSSTSTALTLIGVGFNLAPPTLNVQPNTSGVLSINNSGYSQPLDMSTLYGGTWFIGADNFNGSCFSTITPAVDPNDASKRLFRLGGGAGSIFFGGTNQLRDYNPGTGAITSNVVIGDPRAFGSGIVRYGAAMSYSGTTTIGNGTLLLNFADNTTPVNTQVIFGTPTTNGTLDLSGHNTTVGGLTVATGANAANQIVTNSVAATGANSILTVDTTKFSSSFAGVIKNGTNKTVALTVQGGNTLTLSGANTYTGATT